MNSMPFSCLDPLIVAETVKQMYAEYPEFTSTYETDYNQKFNWIRFQTHMASTVQKR